VQLDLKVLRAHKEMSDRRVMLDHRALQDHKVMWVRLALRALLDRRVRKVM
jgi:hypothetical protein